MKCKCGSEMLVIKKKFAWYWCGKCGRFLNGETLIDPGVVWLEPTDLYNELYDFFMWFRDNGEKYIDRPIESMIKIYMDEKKQLTGNR